MARMNIFEGARRIGLLIKVLWLIVVAFFTYNDQPYVQLKFASSSPIAALVRVSGDCQIGVDATEYITRDLSAGRSAGINLCFRAQSFDNGKRLVPYRVDDKGMMWGNDPYSPDVAAYTRSRANDFVLADADARVAEADWGAQRRRNFGYGFAWAVGGWVVLSVIQALIGWVVRGFLGIPSGRDDRPEQKSVAAV
jgi:hypothetical protein